jgi:hypothetical protein
MGTIKEICRDSQVSIGLIFQIRAYAIIPRAASGGLFTDLFAVLSSPDPPAPRMAQLTVKKVLPTVLQ